MKIKHSFFQNSLCLNKFLHRFEIKEEYPEGVLEVCQICKRRQFYKVIDDKLNNADYMSWHFKNVLPPNHPMYAHNQEIDPYETGILSPIQI